MSRAWLMLSALLGPTCPSWMNAKVNGRNDCLAAMNIVCALKHRDNITRDILQVMCNIWLTHLAHASILGCISV